jgi:hypothetical protein
MLQTFSFIVLQETQDWINFLFGFIPSMVITYLFIIIKFNKFINRQIEINDQYRFKLTSQSLEKHEENSG